MGVSTLHEKGLHGKGQFSTWLYGGVVHAIRHFSSSWFSREREFSVVQARLACYIGIRTSTNLGLGEIPVKFICCFELCRVRILNQNFLHKVTKFRANG